MWVESGFGTNKRSCFFRNKQHTLNGAAILRVAVMISIHTFRKLFIHLKCSQCDKLACACNVFDVFSHLRQTVTKHSVSTKRLRFVVVVVSFRRTIVFVLPKTLNRCVIFTCILYDIIYLCAPITVQSNVVSINIQ